MNHNRLGMSTMERVYGTDHKSRQTTNEESTDYKEESTDYKQSLRTRPVGRKETRGCMPGRDPRA